MSTGAGTRFSWAFTGGSWSGDVSVLRLAALDTLGSGLQGSALSFRLVRRAP